MNEELELKLALTPQELARLRRNPFVRSLATRRASTKRLFSTYYDTPEQSLRRRGMALRVRRVGKDWVQTLKLPLGKVTGLQNYREFEVNVSADKPELDRIEDPALRQLFADEKLVENLKPVFTTEFARSSVPLRLDDSEVELALDQGEITAGEARMPICEAELELVSGRADKIYELALALRQQVPFRLETRTKAARGYGLTEDAKAEPRRATALRLKSKMTVEQAFVAVARNCLAQIRANEAAALMAEDVEGIHQLRVGVRRLRALVSAFKAVIRPSALRHLKEELSWLQGELGPAREWDVFAEETLRPLRARLPEDQSLAVMATHVEAARAAAYERAHDVLLNQRYTELLLRLEMWLESGGWAARGTADGAATLAMPIGRFAAGVLEERSRKLAKAAHKHGEMSEVEFHAVRILAKKLRYPTEFFRGLYARKAVKQDLKKLADIQDTLGSLNDAVVGKGLLEEIERRMTSQAAEADCLADTALGLVHGWHAACIERDLTRFAAVWASFAGHKPCWR